MRRMNSLVLYMFEVQFGSQEKGQGGDIYLGRVCKGRYIKRIGVDEGEKKFREYIGERCIQELKEG